jgi:hypothetical protein
MGIRTSMVVVSNYSLSVSSHHEFPVSMYFSLAYVPVLNFFLLFNECNDDGFVRLPPASRLQSAFLVTQCHINYGFPLSLPDFVAAFFPPVPHHGLFFAR